MIGRPLRSDAVSETALRRGVKTAGSIFLIACGIHLAAHYQFYLSDAAMNPARAALRQTMESYAVIPAWHVTAWTVLCAFSLGVALFMGLAGTAFWWMGKDLPAARLRPLATASAGLCFGAALLVAALHPLPQLMAIFALAGGSFALGSAFGRVGSRHGDDR